jgi:hypothetical protein
MSEAFNKGLQSLGITMDDFQTWEYSGGNQSRHLNYFRLKHPNTEFPPHENRCICGHPITENCYMYNGIDFLVLGNCCIKRYAIISGRSCEDCGNRHQSRNHNKCSECKKKKYCIDCKKLITTPRHTKCLKCYCK